MNDNESVPGGRSGAAYNYHVVIHGYSETVTYRCMAGHNLTVNADLDLGLAPCPYHKAERLTLTGRIVFGGYDLT